MRSWRLLLLLAVTLHGSLALAADATAERTAPSRVPSDALPLFGMMADAGLPDGFNGALVIRPRRWLRTHVGGGYNMISSGVRAGATLAPFGWGPSVTLEGGHYFDGNANGIARKIAGSTYEDSRLLERVGYDYANAHLGFEMGYRRVSFYVHGGMSYVRAKVHNFEGAVQSRASMNDVD